MSRRKAKGTTPIFRDKFPGGEVVVDLATQNMNLRKVIEQAQGEISVTKTMLAAVLYSRPGQVFRIDAQTIKDLEGRAFTIEKRVTEDGGLELRANVVEVVEAEPVEEEDPREDTERNR